MDKPANRARYSLIGVLSLIPPGVALVSNAGPACAPARPPTTLVGPIATTADDRAMARLTALAWSVLDELDPVARDEAGAAVRAEAVWPAATNAERAALRDRLQPVLRRLEGIDQTRLSPSWRLEYTLLTRRLARPSPPLDAYEVQRIVGRGLWSSLGPETYPSARRLDRLESLGAYLATARSATAATSWARLTAAANLLDAQRVWVAQLGRGPGAPPEADFRRLRDRAVAALDVHELRLEAALQVDAESKPDTAVWPWSDHWTRPPDLDELEEAAGVQLTELQHELLKLAGFKPPKGAGTSPQRLARRLASRGPPALGDLTLAGFLTSLGDVLSPDCPAPPTLTATTAADPVRGLTALHFDRRAAEDHPDQVRLLVSVDDNGLVRDQYPPAKLMALTLYEGWPGRALRFHFATRRADRGLTERRWPDPVLEEGWPLYALDRLVDFERLPPAVRWHASMLMLKAVVDAQVDLRAMNAGATDRELRAWLIYVGGMTPAEAQHKVRRVRSDPGRLAAPFLGWLTLARLADQHLRRPDPDGVRRLAACTEFPPDLLPDCLVSRP